MTSKNYILLSGLFLALWIIFASALLFIFPFFFPFVLAPSALLGWMLGRSADQNPRDSIAYAYSVGPSVVAAISCTLLSINKPNENFNEVVALLYVINFIVLLCGFSIARHIFPQETATHSK
jgi:hypothetical protein